MTTFEKTNSTENSTNVVDAPKAPSSSTLLSVRIFEYLFLAAFACAVFIANIYPEIPVAKVYAIAFVSLAILLFILEKQLNQEVRRANDEEEIIKKAELYSYIGSSNSSASNSSTPGRVKALKYSQELINDYKKTRSNSRNIYYVSQIATVVLSGATPIFVLVDKLETNIPWFKWLPVILPAVASIVASVVTSFPFQETSVTANTIVELLEAEQEKFVLGVTPLYRTYDVADETEREQKERQAIENFIVQVNNIHLKQVQQLNESKNKDQKEKTEESTEEQK
jgi:hypothetical protein